MRKFVLLIITTLLITSVPMGYAQGPDEGILSDEVMTMLDGLIERINSTGEVPGYVLWVNTPDGTYELTAGYANLEDETPISADQAFRVGSITKTFTSTVILQLVEEGIVNLDNTIDTYLPADIAENTPNSDIITVRQLLNHTAGTMNYTDFLAGFDTITDLLDVMSEDIEPQAILEDHFYGNDPLFAPGEDWSYSNSNYVLLGIIIETITEDNIANQYRTRILDPLGMEHTYLGDAEEPTVALVTNYTPDENGEWYLLEDDDISLTWAWAAGAMISTAEDLAIFARALFNGELFDDPATLDEMLVFVDDFYGLGVATIEGDGLVAYGHDGGIPGFATIWTYVPSHDAVIVSWINTDAGAVSGIVPVILGGLPALEPAE